MSLLNLCRRPTIRLHRLDIPNLLSNLLHRIFIKVITFWQGSEELAPLWFGKDYIRVEFFLTFTCTRLAKDIRRAV